MAILKNPDIALVDERELRDMDLAFYLNIAWMANNKLVTLMLTTIRTNIQI
jgi:DNA-binding FadR family transcriptional regulator